MNDSNLPTPPYPPTPAAPNYGPIFPMTFGQILDRIFRLMRSHWKTFIAIGMLPMGIVIVFETLFFGALALAGVFKHPPAQPNTAAMLWTVFPLGLLFLPIMLLMYGLYYGATSYSALRSDHDFKVTAGESFRHAWANIGRYTWLLVLRSVIVAIPIFVLAFVVAVGALLLGLTVKGTNPNTAALFLLVPLVVLFYLGAIVYAIIMSLRLSLAFPASLYENLTAWQAIKRSGKLTNGAKGRIFLVLLIVYFIGAAVAMVMYAVGLFVGVIGALVVGNHINWNSPATIAIAVLASIVVLALLLLWSALLSAAYSTAFAVFYRDQCLRQQGPPPLPAPAPAPITTPIPEQR
jgi:hypothetical protein